MNIYLLQIQKVALQNKYTSLYIKFIDNAIKRDNSKLGETEMHHILPRCFKLGGEKDASNIVQLTVREHFIAHRILTKMFQGKRKAQMYFAFWSMCTLHNNRRSMSSKVYQLGRRLLIEAKTGVPLSQKTKRRMSIAHKGKNHHYYGKKRTKEVKEKLKQHYQDNRNHPKIKTWQLISPTNVSYTTNNLKQFCIANNLNYRT